MTSFSERQVRELVRNRVLELDGQYNLSAVASSYLETYGARHPDAVNREDFQILAAEYRHPEPGTEITLYPSFGQPSRPATVCCLSSVYAYALCGCGGEATGSPVLTAGGGHWHHPMYGHTWSLRRTEEPC